MSLLRVTYKARVLQVIRSLRQLLYLPPPCAGIRRLDPLPHSVSLLSLLHSSAPIGPPFVRFIRVLILKTLPRRLTRSLIPYTALQAIQPFDQDVFHSKS